MNARDKEEYYDPKGSIFVVAGTGGADLHNFTGQEPYIVTQFQRFGFIKLETIQNVGTFYENREAADKDNFIINKSLKEEK